jgi:arsenate reductase-like glutaredoxin family protein
MCKLINEIGIKQVETLLRSQIKLEQELSKHKEDVKRSSKKEALQSWLKILQQEKEWLKERRIPMPFIEIRQLKKDKIAQA